MREVLYPSHIDGWLRWGFPGFVDRSIRCVPKTSECTSIINPTKTRRPFTSQQKAEAIALCLSEGLSCTVVAQRLGLPNNSLAKWVRQARIDRGDFGPPDQGKLTNEERVELDRLRKENQELRKEKDFFRLAAAHFAKEQLPPRGFA